MTIPEIIAELKKQQTEKEEQADANGLHATVMADGDSDVDRAYCDGYACGLEEAIRLLTIHTLEAK